MPTAAIQGVACDEVPPSIIVVVFITTQEAADEYQALVNSQIKTRATKSQGTSSFSRDLARTVEKLAREESELGSSLPEPKVTVNSKPFLLHIVGFSELSYKPSEDPLLGLKTPPLSLTPSLIEGGIIDRALSALADDAVFVSFSNATPVEGQNAATAISNKAKEVLMLLQQQVASSLVYVQLCRHPVPPPGYDFDEDTRTRRNSAEVSAGITGYGNGDGEGASRKDAPRENGTNDMDDPTFRAIKVSYNGKPLRAF